MQIPGILRFLVIATTTLILTSLPQVLAQHTSQDRQATVQASSIGFTDCKIGSAGYELDAQCASVSVAMDPDNPSTGDLELSIARIPSRRQSGNTDALTLLAGGPGQSALDSFPSIAFAFRHIMRDRDVILVDQRGTGESTSLDCPENSSSNTGDDTVNLNSDPLEISRLAKECLESLPADPRLFTTSIAVRDLENVRLQLGISQWNIYGISYGTRVAQHYLRRYPDSVRTVTLDAVVPAQVSLGPDIATLAQRSLELIFNRCASETDCGEAFGNQTSATLELLDTLAAEPPTISYEDIATGKLSTRQFTREQLAVTLRLMTYSSQTAAILPSMLHEAIANDNLAPLARQADMQSSSLGNALSTGMHHAIVCTEDVPFFEPASQADDTETDNSENYLGDDVITSIEATCKHWPSGIIDEDFKEPVVSTKPTLILSGEADPVTPPAYGEMALQTLSNARHIVNRAQGHTQAPYGCIPILLARFIEDADAKQLDTSCLERLRTLPFFVDANGPLP